MPRGESNVSSLLKVITGTTYLYLHLIKYKGNQFKRYSNHAFWKSARLEYLALKASRASCAAA